MAVRLRLKFLRRASAFFFAKVTGTRRAEPLKLSHTYKQQSGASAFPQPQRIRRNAIVDNSGMAENSTLLLAFLKMKQVRNNLKGKTQKKAESIKALPSSVSLTTGTIQ
jgi:hypothetical protein